MTECHNDYAMLNFDVKYSFMCMMTNVYGYFKNGWQADKFSSYSNTHA